MAEHTAHGPGLRECAAESVVGVLCYAVAIGIKVANDVVDVVVIWDIGHAIDGEIQQATDTARALQRARKHCAVLVVLLALRAVDCRVQRSFHGWWTLCQKLL